MMAIVYIHVHVYLQDRSWSDRWLGRFGCCLGHIPLSIHYANMSMQYTAIFHGCKNGYFSDEKNMIFFFCSKHRSKAVLMSTHDLSCRTKYEKKNVYPCKPQLYYLKVGYQGCSLHGHVSMM